jgi:hypothetical protein
MRTEKGAPQIFLHMSLRYASCFTFVRCGKSGQLAGIGPVKPGAILMKRSALLLAGAVSVGLAASAMADPGWEFTTAGNSNAPGQPFDLATAFTVNSDVTVSGLGFYADPLTGNPDGNPVALYRCADSDCLTTATLLASTTVTNTDPLDGHFRYATILAINLVAGASYEVAGVSNADDHITWNDPGFTVNPAISILDTSGQYARWAAGSVPSFLTGSDFIDIPGEDGYWGPNVFLGEPITAVPEPATWALMIVGFAGVGFAAYRRRQINPLRPNLA